MFQNTYNYVVIWRPRLRGYGTSIALRQMFHPAS